MGWGDDNRGGGGGGGDDNREDESLETLGFKSINILTTNLTIANRNTGI